MHRVAMLHFHPGRFASAAKKLACVLVSAVSFDQLVLLTATSLPRHMNMPQIRPLLTMAHFGHGAGWCFSEGTDRFEQAFAQDGAVTTK